MIRRLTKNDHEICLRLLRTKPAENIFIIGDIEVYGYEQEFQKLWGDFNESGELVAILLKFEENYIPFAPHSFDASGFAEIMTNDPSFKMMSGLKKITEQIEAFLQPFKRKRQLYYAKCKELYTNENSVDLSSIQQALPHDAEELVELLNSVPEFSGSTMTLERKIRELENRSSRSFIIREDGKIVSTASTAAENSMSAMVVGVATVESYKKKGYATKCLLKLCSQLIHEGKELCLFYDNPEAGAIYKRIGFEDIGFWMMYTY